MEEKLTNRAVILAGGEIVDYKLIKAEIRESDYIICADSGYKHCEHLGITPDIIVGDFDSIGKNLPTGIEAVKLKTDKDYSDTTISVETAIEKGFRSLVLAGMLGGRFDHTFANIQTLVYCLNKGLSAFITDGKTKIFSIKAEDKMVHFKMPPMDNYYFSLFAYSEVCKAVTISNSTYPLNNYNLTNDSARAISNEFIGKEVEITFTDGTLLIMIVPKE